MNGDGDCDKVRTGTVAGMGREPEREWAWKAEDEHKKIGTGTETKAVAVESARGVQQGYNLGPLCYSSGSLKILKEFRASPPVPGARAGSSIDDGHSTTRFFSRYGSYRESYGMTAGMPGSKKHLVEPKEIAGLASRWSWSRTPDGRASGGNV